MIKEPKEKSVVEMCIIRSRQIIQMKKALVSLRYARMQVTSCSIRFPSEDKLKDVVDEIKNRIIEFEMSIAKLLKPILAVHGIILEDRYWLSSDEMKVGYVLFRKPNSLGATHVLFLRDYTDSFDNTTVVEGEIKLYKHVNHFLERLDNFQSKSKKDDKQGSDSTIKVTTQ